MTLTHADFPKDFFWGVATSSYQIEGAVREGGRGESIWDRFAHTPGKTHGGDTGDIACDHYHRFRDDIALMQWLGVSHYRFSLAWPRIIPDGVGPVNQAGLDFYDSLIDALLAANIQPLITLYHWDLPQALQDRGGWANRATAEAFAYYAGVAASRLGDRVSLWATHNEPWCTVFLGHHTGLFAPGLTDLTIALQASHHVLLSHGLAVSALRGTLPASAQVGLCLNLDPAQPASNSHADQQAALRQDGYFNRWFLDPLAGRGYPQDMWDYYSQQATMPDIQPNDLSLIASPMDYLGVNYYNRDIVADDLTAPAPGVRMAQDPARPRTADREIYPEGLFDLLTRLQAEYPFTPIYITENGAAFDDMLTEDGRVHDAGRIAFYEAHLAQAERAVKAGVPIKGYFLWSLMDNFEWAMGYSLRYGMTHVDYATQKRTPKDSAHWYREFLRKNQ